MIYVSVVEQPFQLKSTLDTPIYTHSNARIMITEQSNRRLRTWPHTRAHHEALVGELEGERPAFDEGHDGALRRFSTAIEAVRNDACDAGGPVLLVTHGDCVNAAKYALTDSVEIFDVQECGWVVVGIDGALLDHGRVQLLQM